MSDLNGKKIVIIGAGPTSIGQSAECDEGAIEACRTLNALGCQLIVVNSNPDAVMNDGPWRPRAYIEPLTGESLKAIIGNEQPDAVISQFGGREGLHLVSNLIADMEASPADIEIWGPAAQTLEAIYNRESLQSALAPINLKTPSIFSVQGTEEAVTKALELGFPVVLRCNDAHQLPDGTLIYNQDELNDTAASLYGEAIEHLTIEASLVDWQQVEVEVLRDKSGKALIAGSMEYMDTAAVHPGDAVGVCPPQCIDTVMQSWLTDHALAIAAHLNIIGSATIRFAHHELEKDPLVLAVHPRYTSTSAIISRAYGLPIAQLATLLAAGLSWDDLPAGLPRPSNDSGDGEVVVVKWPNWNFQQFEGVPDRLGPKMQATGQSLGCGTGFGEALQKAMRANNFLCHGLVHAAIQLKHYGLDELMAMMGAPSSRRIIAIFEALRRQASTEDIIRKTSMAPWYINQLKALSEIPSQLENRQLDQLPTDLLSKAKTLGFSNQDLCDLLAVPLEQLTQHLATLGIQRNWKPLPGDKQHQFGTYSGTVEKPAASSGKNIVIIGSGAYEIGNAGEQDYGIFHTALALEEAGYRPIVINNNAVSTTTGPGSPSKCYCDPLNPDVILDIVRREQAKGVITQFAGDMAYDIGVHLEKAGITILGTPPAVAALTRDRSTFRDTVKALGIPQPAAMTAASPADVLKAAEELGYPLSVQKVDASDLPGIVLINDAGSLESYLGETIIDNQREVWIEQFLEFAIEVQAEVLCDGKQAQTAAVLEHIELAGVHAGDSACVMPPYSIAPRHMETIKAYCSKIAIALGIRGLVNIRFAIYRDTVYLLEVTCGASRNLGPVTHTTGIPLVAAAAKVILDQPLADLTLPSPTQQSVGVRAPVFPFNVFSNIDPLLGPQMRATGQVLAIDAEFGMAYFKAIESTTTPLPTRGTVLITVNDEDKSSILEPARIFHELGFKIMATKGTGQNLSENGIDATIVRKLGFGRPNLVDEIKNGKVQMVINTPTGGLSKIDDSVIRKAAIAYRVANITTPASALAAAKGIAAYRKASENA